MKTTTGEEYARYLIQNQQSIRGLLFQWPYRLHLRFLRLGSTLDIGCGAGRNLKALPEGSVGIDHNPILVKSCNERGMRAYTTGEFLEKSKYETFRFSSILISHVAEHMTQNEFVALLFQFQKFLLPGGRIVVICPQEKGYSTDSTHVHFMDFDSISKSLVAAGMTVDLRYSFPFPRGFGTRFPYNEFVVIARR